MKYFEAINASSKAKVDDHHHHDPINSVSVKNFSFVDIIAVRAAFDLLLRLVCLPFSFFLLSVISYIHVA